jgi:hypothetical protein
MCQNVSGLRTLDQIWAHFSKELGFGRYRNFKVFAAKARTGKYLFIIEDLDMLCARLLGGEDCKKYAEDIVIWLNDLILELDNKCPVLICGKLCVPDIVRLANPEFDSPRRPELVEFEPYVACEEDEWMGWSARLLDALPWSANARSEIREAAAYNPGALQEILCVTDEISALDAIADFHRTAARQVFEMIPSRNRVSFLDAVQVNVQRVHQVDYEAIKRLLKNAGIVKGSKEWSPVWVDKWTKLGAQT